jgi:hypothetical protein
MGQISDQDICNFLVALTRARSGVFIVSTDCNKSPTLLNWIDRTRILEMQSESG